MLLGRCNVHSIAKLSRNTVHNKIKSVLEARNKNGEYTYRDKLEALLFAITLH